MTDLATTWKFPFGKYANRTIAECPSWYLDDVRDRDWFRAKHPKVVEAIDKELATRKRSHYEPPEVP